MRTSFILLLLAPVAVAAPVPKQTEKQKLEKRYGKVVDPKGDSKFALDGDKLTITLPANETRSFDQERIGNDPKRRKNISTAPRVEFTASGDFIVTVRVATDLDPKAKDYRKAGGEAFVGGGIQFVQSESEWHYFGPAQRQRQGVGECIRSFQLPGSFAKGLGVALIPRADLPNPSWVRLSRVKGVVELAASADGKLFTPATDQQWSVSDESLPLALTALHCSDKAHTVMFDEFKVEAVKK